MAWGIPGVGSTYTKEKGEEICELIMQGIPLTRVCQLDNMPNLSTVYRWEDDHHDFATAFQRARRKSADTVDWKISEIGEECSSFDAAGKGVRLKALVWRASHLNRKKFGDKHEVAVTGADGGPVQTVGITTNDPVEAARAYQKMLSGEE